MFHTYPIYFINEQECNPLQASKFATNIENKISASIREQKQKQSC